jgi:hypothetical protein
MATRKTVLIKRRKAAGTKTVHYVDNKAFYDAIVEHRALCKAAAAADKERPRISDYIGTCILKIAEKLASTASFSMYSFKDEMISDAIENCFLYFDDFNEKKYSNPFAYFTQVTYFAFCRRIYKEEKHRYTMYKHFQETIGVTFDPEMLTDDDNKLTHVQLYETQNQFMSNFETKEREKKERRKASKENSILNYLED